MNPSPDPLPRRPAPPPPERAWRTARRDILTGWRGVDLEPAERAPRTGGRPMADLVQRVRDKLRLEARRADVEILRAWDSLLDPNVVRHARPVGLNRHGTLFVSVDSSAWLDEIVRYRRREILQRLQDAFGRERIVKISYRVG